MDEKFSSPFGQSGFGNQMAQDDYGNQQYTMPAFLPQQRVPVQETLFQQPAAENTSPVAASANTAPDNTGTAEEDDSFSFEGYQVVRREFFSHKFDPALTIRDNSITFNTACILKLEKVVYIQFLINPETEQLVIRPCSEDSKDAVRWCIVKEDKRKSREITCGMFMNKLHDMMGWEKLYRYRLMGCVKQKSGQQFFLFDLKSREMYSTTSKNPDGTKARNQAYYPIDWRDSFGMPVAEHEHSTDFDLADGFESVSINVVQPEEAAVPEEVIYNG